MRVGYFFAIHALVVINEKIPPIRHHTLRRETYGRRIGPQKVGGAEVIRNTDVGVLMTDNWKP